MEANSFPPASSTITLEAFRAMFEAEPTLRSERGSITWQVNGERILVIGWGCAILMQIAHPLVAEGVAHHSVFSDSFRAKIGRFWRTLDRMLRLTFGSVDDVWKAAQRIDQIHARVYGEREDSATRYSARDIELLKWVHCTFVDSMLQTYSLFIRPLTDTELDDYVYKASIIGPLMGAPRGYFPESIDELRKYLQETLTSGKLKVDAQTFTLAKYVLDGVPIPLLQRGMKWYLRLSTAALLPHSLREAYGLRLSRTEEHIFHLTAALSRAAHPFIPTCLRRWKMAWKN
jgi:uncharacterized protein (DUF2236 family)